jgi:hypothetical protein
MDGALLPGETTPREAAADDGLATGRLVGAGLIQGNEIRGSGPESRSGSGFLP